MALETLPRTNLDRLYELMIDRQRRRDEAGDYSIAPVIERMRCAAPLVRQIGKVLELARCGGADPVGQVALVGGEVQLQAERLRRGRTVRLTDSGRRALGSHFGAAV